MVSMENTKHRVKLYQLDEAEKWQDKGTGHVTCTYVEQKDSLCLVVKSEEDSSILLESKIHNSDIYQRQQDTLVVWNDPDTNVDLALSFQESDGCQEIWDQIMNIQQKQSAEPRSLGEHHEGDDDDDEDEGKGIQRLDEGDAPAFSDLPPANIPNVDTILEFILSANISQKRDRLVASIVREDYIHKLLDLFVMCEDVEFKGALHTLFNIFKALVLLNDTNLMEVLFSEDNMIQMMGVFEYDPEIPEENRTSHREFLTSNSVFKQVVSFNSPELVEKIHQTFRMQYLKDVVLNRTLDDSTFATINSLIFFNNVEIVTQLQNDSKCLTELFSKLKSSETTPQQRKELLLFVQEMCNLAKNLQLPNRAQFYRTITERGLFQVFSTSLCDPEVATRMASTDIMILTLAHDPSMLRGFVAREKPQHDLLRLLIERFISDPELGIKSQCAEILKVLVDTEAVGEEPGAKEEFLREFYPTYVLMLIEPLRRKYLKLQPADGDLGAGFVQFNVCELLSYCVKHHGYRIKYFVLGNNIVSKVLKLLDYNHTYLVLAAIRFFRTFVGMKDDFYNRNIVKNNLFAPIVAAFEKNGSKYNLLNSAIIELFDFIRRENIKIIILYLVENFGETLRKVEYVDTFKGILLKYEQMLDGPERVESSTANGPRKSQKQLEDEDEEAYFRESDEDDDTKSSRPVKTSLVDYELDDDVTTTKNGEKADLDKDKQASKDETSTTSKDETKTNNEQHILHKDPPTPNQSGESPKDPPPNKEEGSIPPNIVTRSAESGIEKCPTETKPEEDVEPMTKRRRMSEVNTPTVENSPSNAQPASPPTTVST